MLSDTMIVDMFVARDEAAIDESRNKYGRAILAVSRGLLRDEESARECENDTYFQAWNSIPPHEPRTYLFPFLARITRHISLDRCRKRNAARRSAVVDELTCELQECSADPAENVEKKMEMKELSGLLSVFIRCLPEEQRMVFMRRYWYGDTVAEIAGHLGWSDSKVKSMLFRQRKQLGEFLKKEGYRHG